MSLKFCHNFILSIPMESPKLRENLSQTAVARSSRVMPNTADVPVPSVKLPAQNLDPAVTSTITMKPFAYIVKKISLSLPKPYVQIPATVSVKDHAFKDDPRIKWFLQNLKRDPEK